MPCLSSVWYMQLKTAVGSALWRERGAEGNRALGRCAARNRALRSISAQGLSSALAMAR